MWMFVAGALMSLILVAILLRSAIHITLGAVASVRKYLASPKTIRIRIPSTDPVTAIGEILDTEIHGTKKHPLAILVMLVLSSIPWIGELLTEPSTGVVAGCVIVWSIAYALAVFWYVNRGVGSRDFIKYCCIRHIFLRLPS